MARPKLPESDLHERCFRVRLKDEDAFLVLALAKKLDQPPAVVLRTLIRQQLIRVSEDCPKAAAA